MCCMLDDRWEADRQSAPVHLRTRLVLERRLIASTVVGRTLAECTGPLPKSRGPPALPRPCSLASGADRQNGAVAPAIEIGVPEMDS